MPKASWDRSLGTFAENMNHVLRSENIVEIIETFWSRAQGSLSPNRELRIYAATPFGSHPVGQLRSMDGQTLLITTISEDGFSDLIVCPVESKTFLLRSESLAPEQPRAVIGFGKQE